MKTFCLEISGEYACFTRPEMKVERVSYDVITPSAARAVFESILWKPEIRWIIKRIEVLKPVRWMSVRRNEVAAKASVSIAMTEMNHGQGAHGLYIEEQRQQRASLFLRDVSYRLHAAMEPVAEEVRANPAKYTEMFVRRATKGQCVNQPYLGCREFAARFRHIDDINNEPPPIDETRDLGWMLHDMDFGDLTDPKPRFFRAQLIKGMIDISDKDVRK